MTVKVMAAAGLIAGFLCMNSRCVRADEFVGPFSSWKNVKTEFGAVGDGKADDTAALQAGLNAARNHVLYLPAGTYRITETLSVSGGGMAGGISMSMIIGEDPEKTIIKWDGPVNGVMFRATGGFNNAKMARLTWDGSGKALTAVDHGWIIPPKGNTCGTANTHEDEIFKDVGFGIRAGEHSKEGTGMDAETHVQRCKFIRCWHAGVSIETFNALDWWLTNCEFIECRVGATNAAEGEYGGGHFHVYHSLFRNSTEADLKIGHTSYFGIRFNTSIGSRAFLLAVRPNGVISGGMFAGTGSGGWSPSEKWGGPPMLQGNMIIDTVERTAIRVFSHGPLIMLDNTIRSRPDVVAGPIVFMHTPMGAPELVSIGNTFTVDEPISSNARMVVMDDRVVAPGSVPDPKVKMPPFAPRVKRPVFEVKVGATTDEILEVVAEALKKTGSRPVIHFQAGSHSVTQSIAIPPESDLQFVGDAWHSILIWKGPEDQPLLHLVGPTAVTMRDMRFSGNADPLILVSNCDQPGSRVHGEMIDARAPGYALVADGVDNLRVQLFGHHNYGSMIIGGARTESGEKTPAFLGIFGGASSNDETLYAVRNGGRMVVWDTWYEGGQPRFLKLDGKGALTLSCGVYSCGNRKAEIPELEVADFEGRFLCQGLTAYGPARMTVRDSVKNADLLFMGNFYFSVGAFTNEAKNARVGFLNNREYFKAEDGKMDIRPCADSGENSPEFIRDALSDLRSVIPEWTPAASGRNATDLRMYRVQVHGSRENAAIVLRGGK